MFSTFGGDFLIRKFKNPVEMRRFLSLVVVERVLRRERESKDPENLQHMSGGVNYLSKFLPISFFRRVSRFIGVSGHLALQ